MLRLFVRLETAIAFSSMPDLRIVKYEIWCNKNFAIASSSGFGNFWRQAQLPE
ncbi:hypothetical protein [Mesorhizobium sp.]|uniref:hypothetical protein n=1 Tax=Mesorhizobium sp. TaxID=1871066 RepID=UPI0025B979DE|nr:hypothetical protein [Mesorhizobium sp.]